MKTVIGLFVLTLVGLSALAQVPDERLATEFCCSGHSMAHGQSTLARNNEPPSAHVAVNGQTIKGKVLEVEGKHFVAVEDLAQSLSGTVEYNGEQIKLTLPSVCSDAQSSHTSSSQMGRIKGTLTYFFNSNSGNKPDTGSDVWLIKGHIEIPPDKFFAGIADKVAIGTATFAVVKHTAADGSGNFDLSEIAPGLYTLVMQSKHTNGAYAARAKDAVTLRDVSGRVISQDVQLKAGETIDSSKDFGASAF